MGTPADDDDDADFLRCVEAAEVRAASKRRRDSQPSSMAAAEEGSYLAALKGSHSSVWQQQRQQLKTPIKVSGSSYTAFRGSASPVVAGGGGGACFKCGAEGHWARDCPSDGGSTRPVGDVGGGGEAGPAVPEKPCPCGAGSCVVLVSKTPKNPGRKFYRCPLRVDGGCDFFEWCDSPSSSLGAGNAQSILNFRSNATSPNISCPCGAGPCLVLTVKNTKNCGRQFYRCPQNNSCGFFKWCDEKEAVATTTQPPSQMYGSKMPCKPTCAEKTNSSFLRGEQEGVSAGRYCHTVSFDAMDGCRRLKTAGGSSSTSGSCFRCGKSGHWSRDCPDAGSIGLSGGRGIQKRQRS